MITERHLKSEGHLQEEVMYEYIILRSKITHTEVMRISLLPRVLFRIHFIS